MNFKQLFDTIHLILENNAVCRDKIQREIDLWRDTPHKSQVSPNLTFDCVYSATRYALKNLKESVYREEALQWASDFTLKTVNNQFEVLKCQYSCNKSLQFDLSPLDLSLLTIESVIAEANRILDKLESNNLL